MTRSLVPRCSARFARLRRDFRRADTRQDEAGAVIILALVFLVAVSFIVFALLGWVGTSLTATTYFGNERANENAATSAVNLAIQNSRYTFTPAMVNASPPVQCWGNTNPSSLTVNSENISVTVDVWCSMVWQPFSATAQNRTVTYSACVVPTNPTPSNPVPTATSCALAPLLQAVVAFDDLPPNATPPPPQPVQCTSPPNGTCGESLTQISWDWSPTVPSVNSISISSAPITGLNSGNPIPLTISGNGFVPGTTVNFVEETGSNPGPGVVPQTPSVPTTPPNHGQGVVVPASVIANSESCAGPNNTNCTLQINVPAVTSGPYYFVTVTTPGGTSAYQNSSNTYIAFTYTAVTPIVSSITIAGTSGGSITGGTTVTVNGPSDGSGGFYSAANFAAQVLFCSGPPCSVASGTGFLAKNVKIQSSSTVTAVSPPVSSPTPTTGPPPYYVQVNTIGGQSSNTTAYFTYGVQVPIIFSLSPTTGPHGTSVTINGYNFLPNSTVGWVPVNNLGATPTNVTTATAVNTQTSPQTMTVTVPVLPTNNTTYVPIIMDPSPYTPQNGYPWSQPYNEAADEFAFSS